MATILTPPTGGSKDEKDYRYSSTGVDLTAPIKLNPNPLDIESFGGRDKGYTQEKWSAFLRFATTSSIDENGNKIGPRINKKDPSLNSQAVWKKLTTDIINEFNTSPESNWVQFGKTSPNRGLQNPLTLADITAIQKFTKKVDPNVQVDVELGKTPILGTQTLQMEYPKLLVMRVFNKDPKDKNIITNSAPELLIPVVWGNKRYITSNGVYDNWITENSSLRKSLFEIIVPYDPTKHPKDKWSYNFDTKKEWTVLASPVVPSESAEKINSETVKTTNQSQTKQLQTKLKSSF
jgi:hypothetical protein